MRIELQLMSKSCNRNAWTERPMQIYAYYLHYYYYCIIIIFIIIIISLNAKKLVGLPEGEVKKLKKLLLLLLLLLFNIHQKAAHNTHIAYRMNEWMNDVFINVWVSKMCPFQVLDHKSQYSLG